MEREKLLKLQEMLLDDICQTAAFLVNLEEFHPMPPPNERRCSFLYRNLANRRLQLECVTDLLYGRELRHAMPVDWRGIRKSTCELCYYPDDRHSGECTHIKEERNEAKIVGTT